MNSNASIDALEPMLTDLRTRFVIRLHSAGASLNFKPWQSSDRAAGNRADRRQGRCDCRSKPDQATAAKGVSRRVHRLMVEQHWQLGGMQLAR